jgi:hypothetical protein
MDDFFAAPPFKADEALQGLTRSLRALNLSTQGQGFLWQGKRVLELVAGDGAISARLARQPAMQPDFEMRTLKSGAEVRQLIDDMKKRLARWSDE